MASRAAYVEASCNHIANAEILPRIALICEPFGLALPYICSPEELLGESQ